MTLGISGPSNGSQGPSISGKFFHKDTGQEIFVRDSINDGVKMCVVLSDGRTMDMSEFQNYVQMSEEEYDSHGQLIGKAKKQINNHHTNLDPNLLFAGMGEKPKNEIKTEAHPQKKLYDIEEERVLYSGETTSNNVNQNIAMINKILEKSTEPEIKISINWPDKPDKEFEMLKNFFDINLEDIVDAIYMKYCDTNKIKEAFKEALT